MGQVLGPELESFRKIAIAEGLQPLLPGLMASDDPSVALLREAAPRPVVGWSQRAAITGRVALAVFGGYAVAALATALLSLVLPLSRAEAVSAAGQLSFAIMAAAIVFIFAARTLARAALGIGGVVLALAIGLWMAGGFASLVSA